MVKKLCIIAHFDSPNFFQWYIALKKYEKELGIVLSSVNGSPVNKKVYKNFHTDPYWQPLREADYVFVYCTRRSSRGEPSGLSWWTLPMFAKSLMKPDAKMICQYDDEFVWLFHPEHVWWNIKIMPNPENDGPKKFFAESEILEIPDAHLVVRGSPFPEFTQYTTKPVFKLLLPQLSRYCIGKYSESHKGKNIAMLVHSPLNSSIEGILENVIRPNNFAVSIFSGSLDDKQVNYFRENVKLPVNSIVYVRMNYDDYEDLLWQDCSIGLDDNSGYRGWSRFAMECAVAYIPCVGSTEAVQDIFPELYTASQDYAKQTELINRLKTDSEFYHKMAQLGHDRVVELMDENKSAKALLNIFEKISISPKRKFNPRYFLFPNGDYIPDKHQAGPHPSKSK